MTIVDFRNQITNLLGTQTFSEPTPNITNTWLPDQNLSDMTVDEVSMFVVAGKSTPSRQTRAGGPLRRNYQLGIGIRVKLSDQNLVAQGDRYAVLMDEIAAYLFTIDHQLEPFAVIAVESDPLNDTDELLETGVFTSVLLLTAIGSE